MQQQDAFFYAVAGRFLIAFLVCRYGLQGIFPAEVYIADGIVYLVLIFFVVVGGSHSFQPADHLAGIVFRHHFGHGNAGVEGEFVRWILANYVPEGFIGFFLVADGCLKLSHQIPFACFLLAAHLVADYFPEVRNGLLGIAGVDIVIGKGIIPFFLGTPVDGIAKYVANHVFGIVIPVLLDIAFGEPGPGFAVDGGLGGVEATHIGKGGGCRLEISLIELRTAHQHPCLPEERVVFPATQPFDVFGCLAAVFGPFRSSLDAVLMDGLLAFLDGAVEVGLADFPAVLVAHGIERNLLGIVVLVSRLFLQRTIDIGECTIIIGVVLCIKGVPPSALRCILLRRASGKNQGCRQEDKA